MEGEDLLTAEELLAIYGEEAPVTVLETVASPPMPRTGAHLKPREREQSTAQHRQGTAATGRQLAAALTVVGTLAAAFLLVSGIVARITLVQLSEEGLALETELKDLEARQTQLRIAYESAFNLGEVEAYARDELGMRKPEEAQIEYIDTAAPDHAQVAVSERADSLVDRIADLLSGLDFREYFGRTGE